MFSDIEQVNQLTSLLIAYGVRHAVVCPGSRNAPIVHNLAECGDITCHAVTDERSAGFYAIGISEQTSQPVVVCVTSGSALLNVAPAVAEAFYRQVPLIVVSADRPMQWIDQNDGQTLQQWAALSAVVRRHVNLPMPIDDETRWHCNRLICEALVDSLRHGGGPVHINVPISEPLFGFSTPTLPRCRVIRYHSSDQPDLSWSVFTESFSQARCPMIVVGQLPYAVASDPEFRDAIRLLRQQAVVVQERLADVEGSDSAFADAIIDHVEAQERLAPDWLLYLGGTLVGKKLRHYLRSCHPDTSIRVSRSGEVCDTFMHLTDVVEASPVTFLQSLAASLSPCSVSDSVATWHHLLANAASSVTSLSLRYSQSAAVQCLHAWCEKQKLQATYFYANSMSVRLGNYFSPHYIHVNRGVNGIEGSLSTAAGYSLTATESLVVCVIGDLSFFYDQNALWNQALRSNLRILLLNNGGGAIFRQLPGLEQSEVRDTLVSASHATSAEGICHQNHVDYQVVCDENHLAQGIAWLTADAPLPRLLEVQTDAAIDQEEWKRVLINLK